MIQCPECVHEIALRKEFAERAERAEAEVGRLRAALAAERERCARLVPTNWCDPLLTGPDAARPPLGERGIEALLRGIQDRIRRDEQSAQAEGK